MYSKFLNDFIIRNSESIMNAYWKYQQNGGKILVVVDDNDKFIGVLTQKEINNRRVVYNPNNTVATIVNKNCKTVLYNDDQEVMYGKIRNIFADYLNINYLPILNNNNDIVDVFSRQRAFWRQSLQSKTLPYTIYAKKLNCAVNTAKALGLKKISAIEFGVAGGNGLVALEGHALELSRLSNIEIEVYGFDTGIGLPKTTNDYKDVSYIWTECCYKMDEQKLKDRLRFSKLVLGDVQSTLKDFVSKYNPAPIGFISVDVDLYSSTVPILDFLGGLEDKNVLPRVEVYFDDICDAWEFQGENLAITEFNNKYDKIKISPTNPSVLEKTLHYFEHELYNNSSGCIYEAPLSSKIHI